MPGQRAASTSGLMKKYGAKLDAAVQAHAADEADYGFSRIPPGIRNGIAKLIEAKFDVYKTGAHVGEYYFRAVGVAIEPKSLQDNGMEVPVAGCQTSIMEAVCDTTRQDKTIVSQDEHIQNILNHLRILGVNTEGATGNDLEGLAAAAKEAGPYFYFSTSVRKARNANETDGVWENWRGVKGLEDYTPPEDSGVVDGTSAATPEDQAGDTGGGGEGFDEFGDIDSLIAKASPPTEDEAAQKSLTEYAEKAGLTAKEINAAPSWQALIDQAREREGATAAASTPEAEAPVEDAPFEPGKGEFFIYKVKDPKNPKKAGVKTEVEVTAVDKKNRTVDLLNNVDRKTKYAKVSWDLLEGQS